MAVIVFYISLSGIILLFLLKSIEIKKGFRPFSNIQERVDLWFHDKIHRMSEMLRYFNWKTFFLLFIFLAQEAWKFIGVAYQRFKKTKFFDNVRERLGGGRGRGFSRERGGEVSPFLSKIRHRDE